MVERLSRLGLHQIQDVLFHLPYRYEDRTRLVPIGSLRHGNSCMIEGKVDHAEVSFTRKGKRRRMLLVHLTDGTGGVVLRFFHFNRQQQDNLAPGVRLRCFGEARFGASRLEMVHPEYTVVRDEQSVPLVDELTPVYPSTDGVSQRLLRQLTQQCLSILQTGENLDDYFPEDCAEQNTYTLEQALRYVHRPPVGADLNQLYEVKHAAQVRLVTEELVAQHLSLLELRQQGRHQAAASLQSEQQLIRQFIERLPFALTDAQKKVSQAILNDLKSGVPMMRLVQGDVGSGKTVVAAMACLCAVECGTQAALMAPTEILAEQHYENFKKWFEPLGINVAWLSGQLKGKKRREVLEKISTSECQVIVGTHALFQPDVSYHNLSLSITDEQHRFGVEQRMSLAEKAGVNGESRLAHQLIMTATPIPRSLAMTAYADLDYSVIDELPPGRKPVTTVVIPEERRQQVLERISDACRTGRQAYWVCTLVEESETLQCQAAEDTQQHLQQLLPDIRVGLVHGRMKADEKDRIMQAFKRGEIQLLVATTVIEVGVDVANASLMIIENAERLGLSQLHQLRGRVGRGEEASHCVLMFKGPLGDIAKQRLAVMRETSCGFEVARKDLQLRGPGEVLGTRQTGLLQLKIADVVRDEYLLDDVKRLAARIQQNYPENVQPLIDRWIGDAQRFRHIG